MCLRPSALPQCRVEGALLLDPSADEVAREEAGLLLALMPTCNEVGPAGAGGWAPRTAVCARLDACGRRRSAARQLCSVGACRRSIRPTAPSL